MGVLENAALLVAAAAEPQQHDGELAGDAQLPIALHESNSLLKIQLAILAARVQQLVDVARVLFGPRSPQQPQGHI